MYHKMFYVGLGTLLGMTLAAGSLVMGNVAARVSISYSDWNENRKQK